MKFRFNEGRMFADVDDGMCVIIDSQTGTYFGMDEESSKVFTALCESSVESIAKFIQQKYDKNALSDLNAFASDLKGKGILLEDSDSEGKPVSDLELASFKWVCDSYTDAQDLILADPIHDVDEGEGWTPVIK